MIVFVLLECSAGVTVDDASVCQLEGSECPSGTNEIYEDNGRFKMCCEAGKKSEKDMKIKATSCRATNCVPKDVYYENSENICSNSKYFATRVMNGSPIEYENLMEDKCTLGGYNDGVVALCCPKNSKDSYLVTTFGSEPNEFPHMAQVRTPGFCGGTVYNKRYIITAAHCVVDDFDGYLKPVANMTVTLTTGNIQYGNGGDNSDQVYRVTEVIPHEEYSNLRSNPDREKGYIRQYNDIALLKLDRDIQFGNGIVRTLEIAPKDFVPENYATQVVVVGWGKTPKNFEWTWLQKSNSKLRNDSACFDIFGGYWWTMDSGKDQLLCVGGIKDGVWSSILGRGDQGGPAICRNDNEHPVLCGIASFGAPHQKCLDEENDKNCPPGGFVDVGYFHDWIVKNAGKQDSKTFHRPYLYGREVAKVTYEHHVHITSDTGESCGGTLIAPDVVITAAQCIFQGDEDQNMYPGIEVNTMRGKRISVNQAVSLPNWKRLWPKVDIELAHEAFAHADHHKLVRDYYYRNDLAIVKLSKRVDIQPDRLPTISESSTELPARAKEVAFITRNGRTKFMEREYKVLENTDCRRRTMRLNEAGMRVNSEDMEGLLCGVELYSGGSTCERELGGGVFCKGTRGSTLCGVQVFRMCERSYPNLFVDLGFHSTWIRETLRELE